MIKQIASGLSEFNWSPIGIDDYEVTKNTHCESNRYFVPMDIQITTAKNTVFSGYYSTNSKVVNVFADVLQSINFEISNVSLMRNVKSFLSAFAKELDYLDAQPNILPPIKIESEYDNVFFEWIFSSDFRMGFTIVEKWEDSSWFLFLQQENIVGSVSGDFSQLNQHIVLRKLLSVVLENT